MNMINEIVSTLLHSEIFWTSVFIMIVAGISWLVKKTKTDKDDKVWAMICNAFNVAEKVIPDNNKVAWANKIDVALKAFNEAYFKKYGSLPPENIVELAKDQWSIIATELKK